MNISNISKQLIKDPFSIYLKALARISPVLLWARYSKLCKKADIQKTKFILSFDCDTEEDIKVVWDVHTRLMDMGIKPVYAVPGELLKRGAKVYRKIAETGSEFINHGGREHTYFDVGNNRHASCFFYDQQSLEALREDIVQGHQILKEVLGITAKGWRTPHFGTFQQSEHLTFLYSVLKELGYAFSTSTVPQKGYQYGPAYKVQEIMEMPVTGIFTEPLNIMDTWAYFAAPNRTKTPGMYLKTCQQLIEFAAHHPLVINIYGDPSHIYDQEEFFEGMRHLIKHTHNLNYSQLFGEMNGNIRNF